ncbi:MAG: sulfurtransferase [Gammaproteobacteria bacterium]
MTTKILMTPADLDTLIRTEPVVVIDTRDPEDYAAGHIPGAVNIREIFTYLSTSDADGLAALKDTFSELFGAAGLSGTETAVIYEDAMNTGFGQSCRGYFLLRSLGYPKAAVLDGGISAWTAAGLPTSQDTPPAASTSFPISAEPTSLMVTVPEMLEAISDPSVKILDVRDRDEWEGDSSSPYGVDFCPRKGRIPSAVWIEWYKLMEEPDDGQAGFRDAEDIMRACTDVGIGKDDTVYVYCFKGARAANTLVALNQAGVKNVKIYFGSWNEWSRDPLLPIEEGAPSVAA